MSEKQMAQIGALIRQLRINLGLSLSELASRAGVGKATLSGIENGTRGNPTIETMCAISNQLGVPLVSILPGATIQVGGTPHCATDSAMLLETVADGAVVTEFYRLCLSPGRTQISPPHPLGTVEYLTVFSGALAVGPITAPIVAPPGSHVSWAADVPHIYAAVGNENAHASLVIRTSAISGHFGCEV